MALPGGGYLIVEHTEAMPAIDVNSESHLSENNRESTASKCELGSSHEDCTSAPVARAIRRNYALLIYRHETSGK